MNVVIHVPGSTILDFEDIERISFVNGDSFGPGQKIGALTPDAMSDLDSGDGVLVVNVNNFIAMEVS